MLSPLQYSAIFEIILNLKSLQLQICYVSFNKIICIVVLVFLLLSSFFSLCFYLYILYIVFMHLCIHAFFASCLCMFGSSNAFATTFNDFDLSTFGNLDFFGYKFQEN